MKQAVKRRLYSFHNNTAIFAKSGTLVAFWRQARAIKHREIEKILELLHDGLPSFLRILAALQASLYLAQYEMQAAKHLTGGYGAILSLLVLNRLNDNLQQRDNARQCSIMYCGRV